MTREEAKELLMRSVKIYQRNEGEPMTENERLKMEERIERQLENEFGKSVTG